MSHRKIIIIISLLLLLGSGFTAFSKLDPARKTVSQNASKVLLTKAEFTLVRHDDGELVVEWECPDIRLEYDEITREIIGVDISGASPCYETGVPRLPKLTQMLDCLPGPVHVQIEDVESETRQLGSMAANPPDVLVDQRSGNEAARQGAVGGAAPEKSLRERRAATPRKQALWPTEMVAVRETGVFRGHRLVSLQFFPVQVDASRGIARITRRIRVRFTMPRGETAAVRLSDRANETQMLRNMLGPLASTALPTRMPEAFTGHGQSHNPLDSGPTGNRWKFIVKEEGVVRVTGADLIFAGCPIDQISTFDMHIHHRGLEIPVHIAGEADGRLDEFDYIEFYGKPNVQTYQSINPSLYTDPYTNDNVYWFSWGDSRRGLRMGEEDGTYRSDWSSSQVRTVTSIRTLIHFEKDWKHDRLSQTTRLWGQQMQAYGPVSMYQDYWFFGEAMEALTTRNFTVFLPYPETRSTNGVLVRAALQGFTSQVEGPQTSGPGHHRAIVRLNGTTAPGLIIGKVSWNDNNTDWMNQEAVIIQNDLSESSNPGIVSGDLLVGNNTISVFLPGDGMGGINDKIYANWFEIEYDRQLRVYTSGVVSFRFDTTRQDTFSYDIRGFSSRNIQVWKVGRSRLTNLSARYVRPADEGGSWAVRFQLISDDAYEIVAFDQRYPKSPAAILPETSNRDLRNLNGAEYLLIYHDSFINDLSLLRIDSLRRASFNGSVDTIRVSQIYEQFNHGIESPEAIRDFLRYAYDHWPIRPTHVCLVGDGMLNTRFGPANGNLIPSLYPLTLDYGIAASDMLFGTVSGPPWDIIPDITVGRISCRTSSELQTYVEKLVRYEDPQLTDYNSPFHCTALFIADRKDAQFNFALDFSEPIVRLMPNEVNVSRVYLDSLSGAEGPTVLRYSFLNGAIVMNYNGHGGGGVWSGTELIDVGGVTLLNNRRTYPFINSFTCYSGVFDERDQSLVLGEAFLFTRNSRGDPVGAIGVYSSTGVGWAFAGVEMQKYLFDFILNPPPRTLGEIIQFNKTQYWSSRTTPALGYDNYYSQMMMMSLLGDPGVRLASPQESLPEFRTDTNIVSRGDTVHISGILPWEPVSDVVDVYLMPFNGETYDYSIRRRDWDPALQESVWVYFPRLKSSKVRAFNPEELVPVAIQTRVFQNLPLAISNFTTAQGNLVVYVVDQGRPASGNDPGVRPRDAIGSLPIFFADSLSIPRIFNLNVLPHGCIYNDSIFSVQAQVAHQSGVERVKVRGIFRPSQGPLAIDTVEMTQVRQGVWETPSLGPRRILGGSYRMEFRVKPYGGDYQSLADYTLAIEQLTDFQIESTNGLAPRLIPGAEPLLVVPISHNRYANSREFPELAVRMEAIGRDTIRIRRPPRPDSLIILTDTLVIYGTVAQPWQQSAIFNAYVRAPLLPMRYAVGLRLDPANAIPELNENDNTYSLVISNVNIFPASNELGTYLPRREPLINEPHRYRKSGTNDTIWVKLPPGSLPIESTTLVYHSPETISAAEQTVLNYSGLLSPDTSVALLSHRVTLADTTEWLAAGGEAEIIRSFSARIRAFALSQAISRIQLFAKPASEVCWRKLNNPQVTILAADSVGSGLEKIYILQGHITATSTELGTFAVFLYQDARGPEIEVAVDGMKFTPHSVLPRHPAIYAKMSDLSGVDRRPGKFFFILDQDTIPDAEISWSDSALSRNSISALIHPELEPGPHVIRIKATDNSGLTDSLIVEFDVRATFGFEWAINYPNPFEKSTTIAYLLSDVTDDFVEVKIYTVAGRHISTVRETARAVANYREVVWDGRDFKGEEVANGVYFARLIAKHDKQKVEKIVKLAKVR
ncbi:hypothetical protein EHM69_01040 [candidate division KSB1 bacterium]|nr:MAG: hypothetical protein EHM69_01040 [candidate division KSB1 bacterium]